MIEVRVANFPGTVHSVVLADGATAADFVRWFPGVTAEQVRVVLEHAARSLQVA